MKFRDVKVGNRRLDLQVHPAADAFPLIEGEEFDALLVDVKAHGFRSGIVVQGDQLLDGRNRLRIAKKLDLDPPVVVLDAKKDAFAYIISTNIRRRHLSESQRAYVAATLATLMHGAGDRAPSGKFAARSEKATPTQADAAKLMQVSERLVRDAARVRAAGDDELIAAVKTGRIKVSAAADVAALPKPKQREIVEKVTKGNGEVKPGKVKSLAKQEAKRATIEKINTGNVRPMGLGPFGVIVVDYPWPYDNADGHEGSRGHVDYPTMTLDEIRRHAATDVARNALDDCILALWTTNAFVPFAESIVRAAGFTWRTMITWDKLRAGVGTWPRGQTEHLVIASRGKPDHTLNQITTYHAEERREHSRKPDGLMAALAKHCAGPHLEMYAREERPGWVVWGYEVGKFTPRTAAAASPPTKPAPDDSDDSDDDALTTWGPAEPAAPAVPEPEPLAEHDPATMLGDGSPRPFTPVPDGPWNCDCGGLSGVAPRHMRGDVICQDKAARAERAKAPKAPESQCSSAPPEVCEVPMTMGPPNDRGGPTRRKHPYESCELAVDHEGEHRAHAMGSEHIVEWTGDGSNGCVYVPLAKADPIPKLTAAGKPATVAKHEASFQAARKKHEASFQAARKKHEASFQAARKKPMPKHRVLSAPVCGRPARHGGACNLDAGHVARDERHSNGKFTWALRGKERPAPGSGGDCAGCRRGGRCAIHAAPGKPAKRGPRPAAADDEQRRADTVNRELQAGDMILVRWPPGTKRARFSRYTRGGDLVVNVQAVDRKGAYLDRFGSDRTFAVADYAGRAP